MLKKTTKQGGAGAMRRAQTNELDGKIAAGLGWTNVGCQPGGNVLYAEPLDDYNTIYSDNKHSIPVPEYTTTDAAAMTLLPTLAERGYRLELVYDESGCSVSITDRYRQEIVAHHAATVSEAVSQAVCKLIDSLVPVPLTFGL